MADYLRFDLSTALEPGAGPNCLWKGLSVDCGPKGLRTDTNLLFRNLGDGTFADVSHTSVIAAMLRTVFDDRLCSRPRRRRLARHLRRGRSTAAILFRDNRNGAFTDIAVESGTAYDENGNPQAGIDIAVGDYNRDGLLDVLKTHFADDVPALSRNLGKGLFQDVASSAGLAIVDRYVERGAGMPDLDNDGLQDLVYVTGNVPPEIERALPKYRAPGIASRLPQHGAGVDRGRDGASGAADTRHSSRGAASGMSTTTATSTCSS